MILIKYFSQNLRRKGAFDGTDLISYLEQNKEVLEIKHL